MYHHSHTAVTATVTVTRMIAPAIALRQSAGDAVPLHTLTIEPPTYRPHVEHHRSTGGRSKGHLNEADRNIPRDQRQQRPGGAHGTDESGGPVVGPRSPPRDRAAHRGRERNGKRLHVHTGHHRAPSASGDKPAQRRRRTLPRPLRYSRRTRAPPPPPQQRRRPTKPPTRRQCAPGAARHALRRGSYSPASAAACSISSAAVS